MLRDKLSTYVRLAAGGETVLVTHCGRVVAELGPPRSGQSAFLSDPMLAEAVRKGWITPPAIVGEGPPPRGKPVMTLAEILLELERDREDR